ncbi:DUF6248 family natural product biosynthesis protein [Nocardiopsis ganjiahuensis]|uniref:DUF6248 family natural product biosynthesis protein n=1 Tax=Nocardiopsis ganjiahuensis TaxID=239984 RepID=UPI00036BC825|nr:DUF6248 family natural product biosynthesis protein [Nocardiopsis ganjiahuensis]
MSTLAPPRARRASRRTGTSHPDQPPACACQWGPTGHCHHGDHDRCQAQQVTVSETYLTHADGTVVLDPAPVEVWLANRTCRWVCSCTCHTQPAQPVQTALF